MRLELKKSANYSEIITNSFAYKILKENVYGEIEKLGFLSKMLNGRLSDEEYKKALEVYDIEKGIRLSGYKILFTALPYKNEIDGKTVWQYRTYEVVLPSFDVDALTKVHDLESIQKLIDNGAVIVDMIPYGSMSYKEGLEEKSIKADKIPTVTNMNPKDERYEFWLTTALKNYNKDLIRADNKILLETLRKQLEYIKKMTKKSKEMTIERLETETNLIEFCDGLIKSL